MKILSPITVCAALLGNAAFAQTTWYVDVAGAPPGLGTQANPYSSIQYAVDQPSTIGGDSLLVAAGTYFEDLTVNKTIRIRGVAGPLLTALRPSHEIHLFNFGVASPDQLVLEGFTIAPLAGWSGFSTVDVYLATLRRCVVRDNPARIGISANVEAWVFDSVITNNRYGVSSSGFGYVLHLRNSVVFGNVQDLDLNSGEDELAYCAGLATGFLPVNAVGNVLGDPELWDIEAGDYFPRPGSPCIDAGDPTSPLDPDGSRADIGLFPYDSTHAPPPSVYCTSKTNSLGCVPAIGANGSASASGAPFTITCTNELNHKLGLLFYGNAELGAAYQGGYLCVSSPVRRTPVTDSGGNAGVNDCSGVYSFNFDALIQSGADPALVAGEIVYAQFWSRDPAASFNTVRSDGLRFGIAP